MGRKRKMEGAPDQVAGVLIRTSIRATRREFAAMVAYAMRDNTRQEVAAIAEYTPKELKELLPQKYLH